MRILIKEIGNLAFSVLRLIGAITFLIFALGSLFRTIIG